MRNMTYTPVRSMPSNVTGPAFYGHSGCGCGGPTSRRSYPLPLSGGCGCGGGAATLGDTPLTSFLCSQTAVAKSLTKEANESALVIGLGTGAAAGLLASVIKSPALGLLAGSLVGYLVYTTQRLPEP